MRTILCVSLVVSSMLGGGGPTAEESPVGALAIDERRGDQWDWAVNYETANAAQSAALRGVRRGVLRGADVRALRGVCGRSGHGQYDRGLGRGVQLGVKRPASGAVAVQRSGRRVGVHRAGLGLQRPRGGRGAGPGPGVTARDSTEVSRGRLRPGRCGRDVQPADAGGDPGLADAAGRAGDRVFGRPGSGGAAIRGHVRSGGGGRRSTCDHLGAADRRAAGGDYGAGEPVLAVDYEQHERGGVRGVSRAVPQRRVQRAGASPGGGAAIAGGGWRSGRDARRRCWVAGFRGPRARREQPPGRSRDRFWERGWRRASGAWGGVPRLRGLPRNGGAAERATGLGPLRGDGGRVPGVRVGDGGRCKRLLRLFVEGS